MHRSARVLLVLVATLSSVRPSSADPVPGVPAPELPAPRQSLLLGDIVRANLLQIGISGNLSTGVDVER